MSPARVVRRLVAATMLSVVLLAGGGCGGPPDDAEPPTTAASEPADAGPGALASPPAGPVASAPAGDDHGAWDVTQMPDPCRTVTRAQVAAAVQAPVEAGTRLESWPPLCSFRMPGPPEEFVYVADDSRPAAKEDFDRQRTDSATPETVRGIGDDAYWLPDYNALHIYSGSTHLTVKFAGDGPPPQARDKALTLARIALPRATADA